MNGEKFKSVRRKFTPQERERFQRGKREVAEEMPDIKSLARRRKAEMEATFAAMQMLKAEREKRKISLGRLAEQAFR